MRFIKSFGHAVRGMRAAWHDGINFKIHILISVIVIGAAYYYNFSYLEWIVLIFAIGIVLFAEIVNTAIERTLDMLEPNHHPLVGRIKDMAAGGVLFIAVIAAVVGILLFIRHF